MRDADFTERYNNYNKTVVLSGNIGNPNLGTEKAFNWETGVDYVGGVHWKWSATFFQKQYDQLIDWVFTPYASMPRRVNLQPTGSYFLASNISNFTSRGLETDLNFNKELGEGKSMRGSVGATWIESPGNTSLYLSAHARWLANYSLQFHLGNLRLAVSGLYKFREQQLGNAQLVQLNRQYYLMNLKLETRVTQTRSWVFVQCDNLFNKTVADRFGVPLPGRWLMAGLRVR
jgi:iron complex outermembrane receptor protein